MPRRNLSFNDGEYYHIYNRGFEKKILYRKTSDCSRFIDTLRFLTYENDLSFSHFLQRKNKSQYCIIPNDKLSLCCYCLMPNHFHLLIKQEKQAGISDFLQSLFTSYTKYYSIKYNKRGPIMDGRFQITTVQSQEQLFHITRYFHINPYSSGLIKSKGQIFTYPYSSISEYISTNVSNPICSQAAIAGILSGMSPQSYKKSILGRADYQRDIERHKKS